MKTGQYYFEQLSKKEQKKFTENYALNVGGQTLKEYLQDQYIDFELFICDAFYWYSTPQGYDYWEEISNRKVE